ncbi:hypothetical protein F5876DRAFT_70358 [Lentinula aff. lateritia]|uniref:Uncharacterized protein n=1 Tax=Lentinula aff. lateritia TaxID=2804960 RepID=A0ACC1TK38_9AGAR|nr:hypothetical protein F5876DRAFT_70358 [Lentinula aff. lateritia]
MLPGVTLKKVSEDGTIKEIEPKQSNVRKRRRRRRQQATAWAEGAKKKEAEAAKRRRKLAAAVANRSSWGPLLNEASSLTPRVEAGVPRVLHKGKGKQQAKTGREPSNGEAEGAMRAVSQQENPLPDAGWQKEFSYLQTLS